MKNSKLTRIILLLTVFVFEYTNANELKQENRSVLVLPPVNKSLEVIAPKYIYHLLTAPIAERGYYVFPVNTVRTIFESEGFSTADVIHKIDTQKLVDIFDTDLILYPIIEQWESGSEHHVSISVILRDNRGNYIWSNQANKIFSVGSSSFLLQGAINNLVEESTVGFRASIFFGSYGVVNQIFGSHGLGSYESTPNNKNFPPGPYFKID